MFEDRDKKKRKSNGMPKLLYLLTLRPQNPEKVIHAEKHNSAHHSENCESKEEPIIHSKWGVLGFSTLPRSKPPKAMDAMKEPY
jgi:hypothetical protein